MIAFHASEDAAVSLVKLEIVQQTKHPERPSLWIAPFNEAGERKMVCTTIRPTLLPHAEAASLSSTLAFLSDFITYEPLPDCELPPDYLASPQSTVKWQVRAPLLLPNAGIWIH